VDLIRTSAGLRSATDAWRAAGARVGFVATLGGIHEGHLSLVRRARRERDRVVASIYLNPRQFTSREDLERYPRDEAADLAALEAAGVDAAWVPPDDEVYPPGVELTAPDPGPVGDMLEGASRPGHFAAVLLVVHRLLDVVGPCSTYFGEKDAQQLFLVERMVREHALPVEVVRCPTVREPDGLAMSSRNALLGDEEREQAGCLFLALAEAAELARAGEADARVLVAAMAREIGATPLARLDYAAVVDEGTFGPVDRIDRPARALVAARFPSARLIDNLLLPEPA
jgi:pantoate--beta-alanine ligase